MKFSETLLTAATTLMLSTTLCSAAVFDFDFTPSRAGRNAITASGTFTTDDMPFASRLTAVTGTVDGADISSIDPNGFNIYLPDTNAADFSFLDADGGSFRLSTGGNGTDMATSDAGQSSRGTLKITPDVPGSTPSTVPLPASAPMFGAALVALSAVGYGLKWKGKASA